MQTESTVEKPFNLFFQRTRMPKETLLHMEQGKTERISEAILETVTEYSEFSDYLTTAKEVLDTIKGPKDKVLPLGTNHYTHMLIFELLNLIQFNLCHSTKKKYESGNSFEWAVMGTFGDVTDGHFVIVDNPAYSKGVTLDELVQAITSVYVASKFLSVEAITAITDVMFDGDVLISDKETRERCIVHPPVQNSVSTEPLS